MNAPKPFKKDQFFIVGERPVRTKINQDGSMEILAFNWQTRKFEREFKLLERLFFSSMDDIDEVTEEEFNKHVDSLPGRS